MTIKIALLGYGKMNQLIEQLAVAQGHQIVGRFSRQLGTAQERPQELAQADLAIDCSQPATVLNNLKLCLSLKKPIVIGTTGWEEHLTTAKQWVNQAQGSCLYAPNFSIGIYLFQKIMAYAASLLQAFPEYDVSGIEYHHRQKKDQPSGTAKNLSQQLQHHMPHLSAFEFTSVRSGYHPGTHTVQFDSAVDTLILTHQARNREGFAQGALRAAEWLLPRQGFFMIEEMMHALNSGEVR